jgi:23S rRNA (uracil1939-C5)-methyltransferase
MTQGRRPRPKGAGRPAKREAVRIRAIAAGGEGVGSLADGRAVFVHRTAPGEQVEVELLEERGRWARGRLLRVIEPGDARREAPCRHYDRCGGCTLEHLVYQEQLAAKGRIVADALQRIAGIHLDPPDVVASPREFRYRNRVSFSLVRLGVGRVVAGFHALHSPSTVVRIDGDCLLPEEPIAAAWDALRNGWGADANLLPSGERLRLTLRSTAAGSVSLLVEGGYGPGRPEELIERVPGLNAIWFRPRGEAARFLAGTPGLPETWGDEDFEVGGSAFLQVNRGGAELLEEHVLGLVGDPHGLRIIDAYCGIGLHARRLARGGASVVGIELDVEAVEIAERAAVSGTRFVVGRVEELIPAHLPADLLILNPPRAGVDPAVLDAVTATPPGRIIYISCDPATLSRDLKRLSANHRLDSVRCFDLFPQTAHVETVASLHAA